MVHQEASSVFATVGSLAHTITSFTDATNATWPYITMPDFEVHGGDAVKTEPVLSVTFSPLVFELHRNPYEVYTTYNQDWLADGILYSTGSAPPEDLNSIPSKIYRVEPGPNGEGMVPRVEDSAGPFLPRWQTAPAPLNPREINFNMFSRKAYANVFHDMQAHRGAVFSQVVPLQDLTGLEQPTEPLDHPHSIIMTPVWDKLAQDTAPLVGAVSAILDWSSFFSLFLSVETEPIVLVMEGTCGDVLSFSIRGHHVEFLGYSDTHNTHYNHMGQSFFLHSGLQEGQDIDECDYEIFIYPTKEFEYTHVT